MRIHSNSTTNLKQRQSIKCCSASYSQQAAKLLVSKATVHRWKHRENSSEHSCRPHNIQYAFSAEEEAVVLSLREKNLTLDEVVDAVKDILPRASRASVHRLFVRKSVNRRPKKEQQSTGQPGVFKEYDPGFVHIDCFYLPQLEGSKRYCFVSVDRATRLMYLAVCDNKDKESATDFLRQCLEFYPFAIKTILTDNGREFTLSGFKNRYGPSKKEHRLTRPYTPKTNGLVERMNGLIKENTTKQHRYQSSTEMIVDLQQWMIRYNFCRKNRRIGRLTPFEAVCKWYEKQPVIFRKKPEHLLKYRSQGYGT